jgi:GH15 family glucan-1,4-alpha-glucosidase
MNKTIFLFMDKKVDQLVASSRKVISDCALRNGALVAANSAKPYYTKQAKDYRFVWPRDAGFNCLAATLLGVDVHEKFFRWCMQAEGWSRTGLFYKKYFVDGKKARFTFQPDQTGNVLMAVNDYCRGDKDKIKKWAGLIRKSANGLCKVWDKDHFKLITQELWEQRRCFPDLRDNFTYSLAACYHGLRCACMMMPNKKWGVVAEQMRRLIVDSHGKHFYRVYGKIDDPAIDASLLGLVWPYRVVRADDARMKKTVALIEKKLAVGGGVHRFENDEYDGWLYGKVQRWKGGGYWPLLNFWMSIYWSEAENKRKALFYFNKVLNDLGGDRYIPEQIFDNDVQKSISPLCWSHSMFVIAAKRLGYL